MFSAMIIKNYLPRQELKPDLIELRKLNVIAYNGRTGSKELYVTIRLDDGSTEVIYFNLSKCSSFLYTKLNNEVRKCYSQ